MQRKGPVLGKLGTDGPSGTDKMGQRDGYCLHECYRVDTLDVTFKFTFVYVHCLMGRACGVHCGGRAPEVMGQVLGVFSLTFRWFWEQSSGHCLTECVFLVL